MSIEIKPTKPEPEMPKKQHVQIGEVLEGDAEPCFYSDRVSWHLAMHPWGQCHGELIQGHGPSVRGAIGAAIIDLRAELERRTKLLAAMEAECGTAKMSDDQIRRMMMLV